MKITVDMELCEAYGECVFAAPDVFDLDEGDDTVTLVEAEPEEGRRADVERAVAACPVSAITVEG